MVSLLRGIIGRYGNVVLGGLLVYAMVTTASTMFYHRRASQATLEFKIARNNYNKLLENMRLSNEIVSASATIKASNSENAKTINRKITDVHVFSDADVDSLREYADTINNRHTGRTGKTGSH